MPEEGRRFGLEADVAGLPLDGTMSDWLDALPRALIHILDRIASAGAGVWLVGGCVRDAFLTQDNAGDIDLATTLTPAEMMSLFPRTIDTGSRFGTVTLRPDQAPSSGVEQTFEATTLRVEGSYGDGRRPDDVEFGESLMADLQRRDLTMNAMAIDVARRTLHDPFKGRSDLMEGVVKAVGVASDRLREDGLRIMRVYRFLDAGKRGVLTADPSLAAALISEQDCIDNVSKERIWKELRTIIVGQHAATVLGLMHSDGLLARIIHVDVSSVAVCDTDPASFGIESGRDVLVARLAALTATLQAEDVDLLLRRLAAPRAIQRSTLRLHETLRRAPDHDDIGQMRLFRSTMAGLLGPHLLAMAGADPAGAHVLHAALTELPPLSASDAPLVDGVRLAAATGLTPGVRLGRLKSWLHRRQIESDLPDHAAVLAQLQSFDWRDSEPADWPQVTWP